MVLDKVKVKFNCKSDKELKSLQLEKQSIQADGSAEKEEEVTNIDKRMKFYSELGEL